MGSKAAVVMFVERDPRVLAQSRPSQLTELISRMAAGRDSYGVFKQSTEDWTAFAVWSDGKLVRALSLSPDTGITEDLGERLPFEAPFWGGQHPVDHDDQVRPLSSKACG